MDNKNLSGITLGLARTGLVKGTTKTYTTTASSAGMVNGKWATPITAQTNAAVPTVDAFTGLAFTPLTTQKATVIVLGQTLAGVIQACQGTIEPTALGITTTPGAFLKAPLFPQLPDDFFVLGYALVRTAPSMSTTWTFGTDNWAATGVTVTEFVQCGALPGRPVTS